MKMMSCETCRGASAWINDRLLVSNHTEIVSIGPPSSDKTKLKERGFMDRLGRNQYGSVGYSSMVGRGLLILGCLIQSTVSLLQGKHQVKESERVEAAYCHGKRYQTVMSRPQRKCALVHTTDGRVSCILTR